ncbi:hypothetical protein CASFOL_023427 [Castilleja foliolosa]|uniref:Helitron helicase-like domain-containing protein n=1 Tax=Castilleja foliolosa TaxID=1961234 RepID=A0ABD3CKI3_9LAMI
MLVFTLWVSLWRWISFLGLSDRMPAKRKFECSVFEVGQSSRNSRSRRIPNQGNLVPPDTLLEPSYFDDGDSEYIYEYCTALFWFAERIVRGPLHARPRYTHCCKSSKVRLPLPLEPPDTIRHLFEDSTFMENVRAYNNMFSMTSFGAKVDDTVNDGFGPYVFKVSGQVSHWIGSICPPDNDRPRFLQLYIYDTENEIPNRMRFFDFSDRHPLSAAVVSCISETLKSCNEYARLFKSAKDLCDMSENSDFSVRLYNNVGDRRYEPPASGTLGGIVYADDPGASSYDIVVHRKAGPPHRVSKLHPSYMPLQYPLLFPLAEPGWSPALKLRSDTVGRERNLTINMYYSFQIHDRHNVFSLLLNGGLYDALAKGDNNANVIGKRVFLPSSFTGGPRYMYKHYQDALAICRVHGNPQYLEKVGGAHAPNRPDIIARVFRIKVQQFLRFMRSTKIFG